MADMDLQSPQLTGQMTPEQQNVPMQLPAQGAQPAPSPQSGQPAQAPPPPNPQQAQEAHDSFFGKAAKALLGTETQYQVDPNSGQMVATPVQQKPGQLFRNILAAAIMGGAQGRQTAVQGNNPMAGFLAGAAAGPGVVNDRAQQQAQQSRADAQQGYQDQLKAKQEQRDQAEGDQRMQLLKAQTAHANMTNIQAHNELLGMDRDTHEQSATLGRAHLQSYYDAGEKPVFENVPAEKMAETFKTYPGASALDWQHASVQDIQKATGLTVEKTGETPVEGPDGKPDHYTFTYTAFDPKASRTLPQTALDAWKAEQASYEKNGGVVSPASDLSQLKPGQTVTAGQYVALTDMVNKMHLKNIQATKEQQEQAKAKAEIDNKNSETAVHTSEVPKNAAETQKDLAEAGKARAEAAASGRAKGPDSAEGQDYQAQVQQAADSYMHYHDTQATLSKGMGKEAAKFWRDVHATVQQKDPSWDFAGQEQRFHSYQKTRDDFTNGPDGRSINAFNTAISHLDRAETNFPQQSSWKFWNNSQNWLKVQTSDPQIQRVQEDLQAISSELGKAYKGGAPAEGEIQAFHDLLDKNQSRQSFIEGIKEFKQLLGGKLSAYRSQWESAVPKGVHDDFQIVSPDAQRVLLKGKTVIHNPQTGEQMYKDEDGKWKPVPR